MVLGWFGTSWVALWTSVSNFFTNTWYGIKTFFKGVLDAIVKFFDDAVTGIKELPGEMLQIGKDIVNGVWNGIKSMYTKFYNDVKNFFKDIVDGVKNVLGIHSPSTLFENEIGVQLPPGVSRGFLKALPSAIKEMRGGLDDAILDIDKEVPVEVNAGFSAFDSFLVSFGDMVSVVS